MVDVYGGTILGSIIVAIFWNIRYMVTQSIHTTSYLPLKLFLGSLLLLLASPQPRPLTPSFYMNAGCIGLLAGTLLGARWLRASHLTPNAAGLLAGLDGSALGVVARNLIGIAVVLLTRTLVKSLLMAVFRLVGIETYKKTTQTKNTSKGMGYHISHVEVNISFLYRLFCLFSVHKQMYILQLHTQTHTYF